MKPRLIDRLLLALILLIFIGLMVVIILCAVFVFPAENVIGVIKTVLGEGKVYLFARIGIVALAGILALIAIKLLFTSGKRKEKDESNNAALLVADEYGTAYVSAASIDSMAQKYIKANNRIRECSSKVIIAPDSTVSLTLKAVVLTDTNIPELSETVRNELKEYIETYAGVKINQLSFMVVNTVAPNTSARIN